MRVKHRLLVSWTVLIVLMALFDAAARSDTTLRIEAWLVLSWIAVGVTTGLLSRAPDPNRWRVLVVSRVLMLCGLFLGVYNLTWELALSVLTSQDIGPPVGLWPFGIVIPSWPEWAGIILIGTVLIYAGLRIDP